MKLIKVFRSTQSLYFLLIIILLIGFGGGYLLEKGYFRRITFEEKRSEILSEIRDSLEEATQSGEYKCCISPPCKMCFLGDWVFKDGKCDCHSLMVKGQWDKVCPEYKREMEEGKCKSEIGTCPIKL